MKLPSPSGGNFTPTPAGQHLAVCTRFIDLGTQTTETAWGTKHQRKVLLGWEIPAERITWEKDGTTHEGPVLHYERFTFSTHEKAQFRQKLEMWRGKPFTDADFDGPNAFDVKTLIGVGAFLQIAHKTENGKVYANLQAIMLPPGGKAAWPKPEGQTVYLALTKEEFDEAAFAGLSDGLRKTIMASPEFAALMQGAGGQQYDEMNPPPVDHPFDDRDTIPF